MNNPDPIAEIPVNPHPDKLPLVVFFISPKTIVKVRKYYEPKKIKT